MELNREYKPEIIKKDDVHNPEIVSPPSEKMKIPTDTNPPV